ncbi:metallo-beta-lactamase superfamily protein [Lindgomyces ingoldianus]|uniref:Metallo-beta-lactamase superfamily protein n=1 Tax=Lindgomyces ingoldianus TaxID=673940 RepID=A0ACB6QWM0_9PLEO|nr:metallo-beta-lactamase superfamily protein [Lindgomyces ingoldianus]KAF2470465.1 metallo-beta-lactamase superfamily protein [Lindgomyces ingoldianus]
MEMLCCGAHGLSLLLTATQGSKTRTLLFDTGPTESIFTANAKRIAPPLQDIYHIHLSHWHRDHSGGMLAAIQMIQDARSSSSSNSPTPLVVDLHPNRPVYRGVKTPIGTLSLEADPTFEEIEKRGGVVEKNRNVHEVLESSFLVSGEIPRVTEYEHGIRGGVRFEDGVWRTDELIADERFVVCWVKDKGLVLFTGCSHAGVINCAKHALTLTNNAIPLYAIVGGYHLADADEERIKATVRDLKDLDVKVLMAGHCTGWRAKFEIEREMKGSLVPSFVGIRTMV